MRLFPRILPVVLFMAMPTGLAARQSPPRSPRNASYVLEARLDPVNRLLIGRGRLSWRNTAPEPATELRFHLAWNAWRDDASTWMREQRLAGLVKSPRIADGDRGSIDVTALTRAGQAGPIDLLPGAAFIAPDDGNREDRTVLDVPLDRPVEPGGSIDIDVRWNAHVPRPFGGPGARGNDFFIARWFPQVGVFDAQGWHCHQVHVATGPFADFGTYDVRLTVPAGWVVGATGREASRTTEAAGLTAHRYVADDVHGFAWTTSPDFIERRGRFRASGLPPVDLRLLMQPGHENQAGRYLDAAKVALQYYGSWLGPYPWPQLTIVDPISAVEPDAENGLAAGVAYPTLITAGTRWPARPTSVGPVEAIVRGIGRQFWGGVVATDDGDHGWLDDGLDAFTAATILTDTYAGRFSATNAYFGGLVRWSYPDVPWSPVRDGLGAGRYGRSSGWDAPATPSWRAWPGTKTVLSARAALGLGTLERLVGAPALRTALSTYFGRGAWGHPGPDDLFGAIGDASGRDLGWFFDGVYRSAASFDYGVARVQDTPTDTGALDTAIVIRRLGDGVFPVDIRVEFADGSQVTEQWDGRAPWHTLHYRRAVPVTSVQVDPDRVLLLDVMRANNSWTARPGGRRAADKWALRWLTWCQHLLMTYAFFA